MAWYLTSSSGSDIILDSNSTIRSSPRPANTRPIERQAPARTYASKNLLHIEKSEYARPAAVKLYDGDYYVEA